jgi:hypothetical protein
MTPRNIRADLVDDIYRRLLVDIERDVHGNDRAILVQGDEGPAQVVRLGHRGTPSVTGSDEVAISSPPAP